MGALKTSGIATSEIAAWVALGTSQAHVGAKHGLTRQRVGQIVQEFPWVRQSVRDRLRSLDENHGKEGGKCQSSSRGWMGSGSEDLESECGSSGEFRPLSRPERTRWRRVCASRGPGDRRRRRRRGCGGRLGGSGAGLTGGSRRFPPPGKGGKPPVQPHPERGGKCQFSPTRKGGESAIFGAGGDQPPLATSGRCCLAAARLCVSPSAPAAVADGGREIPEAEKAVVRQKHRFQPVTAEKFHRELSLPIGFGDPLRSAASASAGRGEGRRDGERGNEIGNSS